ncbi:hypothetical protein [Brevibacillus centrosporus]|uniref:hypothetical protein n=1 Tax=Brevibacillus centrosporus TaxID=54910 RepID=UPI0039885CD0
MTLKQYGYAVQALTEKERLVRKRGDEQLAENYKAALKKLMNSRHTVGFLNGLEEEHLQLIVQALEDTADRRQIWATTFDAVKMRETAKVVKEARYQEGIA